MADTFHRLLIRSMRDLQTLLLSLTPLLPWTISVAKRTPEKGVSDMELVEVSLLLDDLIDFEDIALCKILVVGQTYSALIACCNLPGIVLEAPQV